MLLKQLLGCDFEIDCPDGDHQTVVEFFQSTISTSSCLVCQMKLIDII